MCSCRSSLNLTSCHPPVICPAAPLSLIKWEAPGSLKPPHQAHQAVLERVFLLPTCAEFLERQQRAVYVVFLLKRDERDLLPSGPSREGVYF